MEIYIFNNKTEALERYQEEKEKILAKELKRDLKFEDFCKSYLKWAASSKPASIEGKAQYPEKIKAFIIRNRFSLYIFNGLYNES